VAYLQLRSQNFMRPHAPPVSFLPLTISSCPQISSCLSERFKV
jgi:hypothetical protein